MYETPFVQPELLSPAAAWAAAALAPSSLVAGKTTKDFFQAKEESHSHDLLGTSCYYFVGQRHGMSEVWQAPSAPELLPKESLSAFCSLGSPGRLSAQTITAHR